MNCGGGILLSNTFMLFAVSSLKFGANGKTSMPVKALMGFVELDHQQL